MQDVASWDPIWDHVFSSQEWGKYPGESLIQFIARNFYKLDRPNVKILEVGCGTGANLWYISRERFDAYGIDGSKVAIDIARERMKSEGLSVNVEVGDIATLPYEDSFFDAVVDVECLYANSADALGNILPEISRVLKPGGLLYSRTFSDNMYMGENANMVGHMEYQEITDGPLKGKGFVRLSNEDSVKDLYSECFDIRQIDLLEYSVNNRSIIISELIVVASKKA
ncbi:2-polyprenyl-3-methyl-5-hydroxy-6-metoxy-1,4-benzoquinol methylase [Chitinophaga dinghuensis]|uniref:2-polyprenyl-3-methyl-5-hydroxy-6-metoxy-1, 4-benzoquinol methylase n=1 Tax=Chitinophaga dinghuensis TaxID=1539050 RepID=A0A327W759_9BACT|nr:class I SAM-dependent methyltransferase [Chitinophaga dinghuensis]RAJ85801.1 2-polyprenyl-3-methyl-5-hydroxy-6-metoxy-1,4-benzoquinol methylase [Chitinophaga dinghuensis]